MRFALAVLALAGAAAAQVTAAISPSSPAPAGCTGTRSGNFQLSIVSAEGASKRAEIVERQDPNGQLMLSLNNGILKDSNGRTGYVASNYQFQFDGPPQAGAIYTAGFSICQNNTIALGGSAIWYSCSSGSSFDNLYERDAGQLNCKKVYFYAVNGSGGESASPSSAATSPATSAATTPAAVPTMATSATAATTAASTPATAPTVVPAQGGAAALAVAPLAMAAAGLVALL